MNTITLAESGMLPYWLLRLGIRQRCRRKLKLETSNAARGRRSLFEELSAEPIAKDVDKANDQHYEVPSDFFRMVLGPRLKYSCCYWPSNCSSLEEAERNSLRQIGERAALKDGQDVLELGCGWGSFSLWAAEHFPNSHFTAVSNSYGQAEYIRSAARRVEISNLEVITCDINRFEADRRFDQIVSVEMLEHVRNYERLFARISHWMKKEARFFAHVFCHKEYAYPFNADNPKEWMAKYFFTGGIMPSRDLLPRFDRHLELEKSWDLDGTHHEKTSNAWLANLNRNEAAALEVLSEGSGRDQAKLRLWRWRLFFLACAELFGYDEGNEWGVAHYVFKKRMDGSS